MRTSPKPRAYSKSGSCERNAIKIKRCAFNGGVANWRTRRALLARPSGAIPYERSHHWLTFFATIADEIVRAFRPASVLDAGCAMGLLVEALWDRGVRAEGIDISNYAIANVRPDMRALFRAASLTDPIEGSFDLVTCIEVLEHLERADAEAAIANLCSVTQTVLFSSTPSDFSELTHVNVCPPIV
jgi:SAM-dependent methyltransferase